jgi:hypothetical protein
MRRALGLLFVVVAGCRTPSVPTVRAAAPRVDAAAPSAVIVASPSDPAPAFDVAAWIEDARQENAPATREPGCSRLVYKRGCAEKRTGRVTVRVAVEPGTGRVQGVEIVRHTIETDPEPMLKCISAGLEKWTFTPSPAAPASFEMTFVYSDKC